LQIKTLGPFSLKKNLDKAGDLAIPWEKNPFAVSNIQDQFESLLRENQIATGDNTLVLFLYFDNSFQPGSDKERLFEYKKFRSFADREKGRAYINIYDFRPSFAAETVKAAIHETLHLFGATDKYREDPSEGICSPEGRGQPYKTPPFPQSTGDIMCLFIEKEPGQFYPGDIRKHTLVINPITAKEIGW
jgi:hypothetical protein